VAIINKASCGVWAQWPIHLQHHGKVGWCGKERRRRLVRALGAECYVTGDTVRAIVSEANQDAAIEALRRSGGVDFGNAGAHFAGRLLHAEVAAGRSDLRSQT
jgi:hypothetical protein